MSGERDISDSELHAYIDGALEPLRAGAVEARLAADPDFAARVAGFAADKAMLSKVYAPLLDRPLPQAWLDLARTAPPPAAARISRSWWSAGAIAAALLVVLAGAVTYWKTQQAPRADEIVQAALEARDNQARADQVIAVKDDGDIARYDAALSQAVALHVKVPDLKKMGYRLAAIHLYSAAKDGAAELVYRDQDARIFTLYVRHSDGKARFDQFARAGLRVCVWQDEELGTVMAGNVSTAAMQRLASLTYVGLTL